MTREPIDDDLELRIEEGFFSGLLREESEREFYRILRWLDGLASARAQSRHAADHPLQVRAKQIVGELNRDLAAWFAAWDDPIKRTLH